jgi:hypothetical protein
MATIHDDDAIRHRYSLNLVVGNVDGGRRKAPVQALDLGTHGDALALAAGELAGVSPEEIGKPQNLRGMRNALLLLLPRACLCVTVTAERRTG